MLLRTHFKLVLIKQLVRKRQFDRLLRFKMIGYHVGSSAVTVQLKGMDKHELDALPHSLAYYQSCKEGGMHEAHWTSRRPVRRKVYVIEVISHNQMMTITTTDDQVYPYINKQYEALGFMTPPKIIYKGWELDMPIGYQGLSCSESKTTFRSMTEYVKRPDTIIIENVND